MCHMHLHTHIFHRRGLKIKYDRKGKPLIILLNTGSQARAFTRPPCDCVYTDFRMDMTTNSRANWLKCV